MHLERLQNSGQGNYVFAAEKSADMIPSCVPKLTRDNPETYGSKRLFQLKSRKKFPNFNNTFNFS